MSDFLRKLRYLFRRDEFAGDLRDEMRLHIELRARKLSRQGISGIEAHYMARRQFGNTTAIQDASSEAWGWASWERLAQDLRIGARTLRKTPGFTAVAVLTLALGLGINTAVFSVVNAVMLRGLPYEQPDRLVSLWEERTGKTPAQFNSSGGSKLSTGPNRTTVSPANLLDYQKAGAFAAMAADAFNSMSLTGEGTPEQVQGESVGASFFSVLSVKPERGRDFLPEDDRAGADPVVIISHDFWQRRLGADPNVLSHKLTFDAKPYQVIGVLPEGFQSPLQLTQTTPIEFFVPSAFPKDLLASHGDHTINVIGRLRPGVTVQAAQSELNLIGAGLARQFPDSNTQIRAAIAPLRNDLVRNVSDSLFALLGATALVVLITCVNVANLLMVRAVARRHETSVRFSLGASRFRIIRQFLAESVLLALTGCVAGVLLGRLLMRVLLALAPANIPRIQGVTMDWRVFAVAALIATVTGVLFGLAPAWQASQAKAADALKTAVRNTGAKAQVRWRGILTAAEVALSLVLLVGAGLMLRSFVRLAGVDLGFQPERVLAMSINLPALRYHDAHARLQFFQNLEVRVKALPGIQDAAFANRMPLRGGWGGSTFVDINPGVEYDVDKQAVSPGYFQTLGIPLLRGRFLTGADQEGGSPVALVNQAFVRKLLPNTEPIGRQFKSGSYGPITIVGVVNDIRRSGKTGDMTPQVYLPAAQSSLYPVRLADVAIRTAGDPRQLMKAVQAEVWALDKEQPITNVRTMDEIITASVAQRRFQAILLLTFAGVAAGLAIVGIFGVLSYAVSQRMNELGIRIALGAQPASILALVLKQAGALIAAGLAAGLLGSFALTRYVESMLFGVKRTDWMSYAVAVVFLASVSIAAAMLPARRGARVDPIVALRYE